MTPSLRAVVFLLAMLVLLPLAVIIGIAMPEFGLHPLPYGDAINAAGPVERHVTNMISAVNFDYRGFDTLGEEFMLLCAVTGVVVLLRGARGERLSAAPGRVEHRSTLGRSDAMAVICLGFGAPLVLFGIYVALHATVTPGGGFQGGVIIASGVLLVFLGDSYQGWRRIARSRLLDAVEGGGAALFALCGFASLIAGGAFLQNFLPFGTLGDVLSGGLMQIENAGVTLAVSGGFMLLYLEFLEETRAIEPRDQP